MIKKKMILKCINDYHKIGIFRHIRPDFDSLGAQFALLEFIKENFKNKDIKLFGDNHDVLTTRLFPKINKVNKKWFNEQFLAIILDTPNMKRIADDRWEKAVFKVKIDHHIFVEKFANIEFIDKNVTSTCEILSNIFLNQKYKINKKCAEYLYIGIIGDSGRFKYNVHLNTFKIAKKLLSFNLNLNEIYKKMYLHEENTLKLMCHILNNYHVSKYGIAYYILLDKDLKKLHVSINQGKELINLFSNIKNIKIWCAIIEDIKDKIFRVSIRSESGINIREVSQNWNGGGHENASGAKFFNLNEHKKFIKELEKLIINHK